MFLPLPRFMKFSSGPARPYPCRGREIHHIVAQAVRQGNAQPLATGFLGSAIEFAKLRRRRSDAAEKGERLVDRMLPLACPIGIIDRLRIARPAARLQNGADMIGVRKGE